MKNEEKITITVNEEKLEVDVLAEGGDFLIPAKDTFVKMGYIVSWDEEKKKLVAENSKHKVELNADSYEIVLETEKSKMDVSTKMVKKTLYIPVMELMKKMDYEFEYNSNDKSIHIKTHKANNTVETDYDVIVVGSDPEGISAAVSAAREGQKTLLVDTKEKIGGLLTLGKLNTLDMSYVPETNNSVLLTRGIFEEFFKKINKRTSFDIEEAQLALDSMLFDEENVTVDLSVKDIKPVVSGKQVKAVEYVDSKGKAKTVYGKQFIDTTQDADFANATNVKFTFGQEDYRGTRDTMSVTLVFELSGVDWDGVKKYLNEDNNPGTGADKYSAWGYSEMAKYVPQDSNVRMRGLNIGKLNNGNVLINALQILGIDGTNEEELKKAREMAENELPSIIKEMRKLTALENVKLVDVAPEMYVRESRHMVGEYRMTLDDVLENKDFEDRIAFGNYPVDVQKSKSSPDIVVGNPKQYSIPFRAIVPKEYTNLLVATRSASYDSLAHGSVRVIPVGMVIAEAAGVAAAYSNENNVSFTEIAKDNTFTHIKKIQEVLNSKNAHLEPIKKYELPETQSFAYEGIKFLRSYALLVPGYYNEYELNVDATRVRFMTKLNNANRLSGKNEQFVETFEENDGGVLTSEDVYEFLKVNNRPLKELSKPLQEELARNKNVTNEILYQLIYEILD